MSDKEDSVVLKCNCKNTYNHFNGCSDKVLGILDDFCIRNPELKGVVPSMAQAYLSIAKSLVAGGTLYLCGNGGSMADALHMSGEMLKSYLIERPLDEEQKVSLSKQPYGDILAEKLEKGLRVAVLGINVVLTSAVGNDNSERNMEYAQHLWAMARPGDVVMGISTSGNAKNVCYAISAGKGLGLSTIALTGRDGGQLALYTDIAIRVPETRTDRIQEQHVKVYHCLCEMLEMEFFGD